MTDLTAYADATIVRDVKNVKVYSFPVVGGTVYLSLGMNPDLGIISNSSAFVPSGVSATEANTAITTVGDGTLTAAALLGGIITRSGSTAAYTDTTDTAALIQAAWTGGSVGSAFEFTILNTTAFAETIAAGSGVTLAGQVIVPANSTGRFLAKWTGTSTITITNISVARNGARPSTKLGTMNATTGSLAAGAITGADHVTLISSNATPGAQLVRTAAQMLADTPNGKVGEPWRFRVVNTGAGTFTLTADGGATVTLSGTMTVLQNTWRDFVATLNTPTTATITATGTGTYS